MSVELKQVVRFSETFAIDGEFREFPAFGGAPGSGALTDPASHSIKLYKPDGTQQGDTMTGPDKKATGQFRQEMSIPATGPAGEWRVLWIATIAGRAKPSEIRVKVAE